MSSQADEVDFIHEPPKPVNPDNPYSLNIYSQGVHERYGPIILSIQAGYGNYCDPRDTYLPHLADYKRVEIAMFDLRYESEPSSWDTSGFLPLGAWTKPHKIGLVGFDELLASDDVEGWVEWDEVNRLRDALAQFYGGRDDDPFSLAQHGRDRNGYNREEYDIFVKVGPMGVDLNRQHNEGRSEVVGDFAVGQSADWVKSILDKCNRDDPDGDHEDRGGWGTSGWSDKGWD